MDRITFNPNQCGGRPCIRGMRVRVKDVVDLLAAGARRENTTGRERSHASPVGTIVAVSTMRMTLFSGARVQCITPFGTTKP